MRAWMRAVRELFSFRRRHERHAENAPSRLDVEHFSRLAAARIGYSGASGEGGMLRVYGDPISGNCLKVKWTLDLLGVPYIWETVEVVSGGARTPAFLAVNPAGQVPAVAFDDGRSLAQSNAILLHFAEGSRLIPEDAFARAKMFEWLFWEQYSHEPYIAVRRFQMRYLNRPAEALDPKLFERGSAALKRLDEALAEGAFLAGPALSLADIALVAYTRVAHEGGFDLDLYPAVKAWVGRVERELKIG
jgi:glutathione S-transferase